MREGSSLARLRPTGCGSCCRASLAPREMMRQVAPAKGMCSAGRSGSGAEIRGLSRDKAATLPASAALPPL
jgi:hypothetical protein